MPKVLFGVGPHSEGPAPPLPGSVTLGKLLHPLELHSLIHGAPLPGPCSALLGRRKQTHK